MDTRRLDLALAAVMMACGESPEGGPEGAASWNAITGIHFAMALAAEAPEVFEAYREEWKENDPPDYAAFASAAGWVAERHSASPISRYLSAAWAEQLLSRDP